MRNSPMVTAALEAAILSAALAGAAGGVVLWGHASGWRRQKRVCKARARAWPSLAGRSIGRVCPGPRPGHCEVQRSVS